MLHRQRHEKLRFLEKNQQHERRNATALNHYHNLNDNIAIQKLKQHEIINEIRQTQLKPQHKAQ